MEKRKCAEKVDVCIHIHMGTQYVAQGREQITYTCELARDFF